MFFQQTSLVLLLKKQEGKFQHSGYLFIIMTVRIKINEKAQKRWQNILDK